MSNGKLKFTPKMRFAFAQCVSELLPVRVVDCPDGKERYVLEVEIRPQRAYTLDMVYSFCDTEGKAVSYIKDGSSVVQSTDKKFSQRGEENPEMFKNVVMQCSRRRHEDEKLQHGRTESVEIQRVVAVMTKLAEATKE